jgi:uncharacterized protein YkwD
MIFLLKTHSLPNFLLPSSTANPATITIAVPAVPKTPAVVLPGTIKKIDISNTVVVPVLPSNYVLTRTGIITQTNKERTKYSVTALTESKQLDLSAQAKADDILARHYFAHVAPDGKTVSDLVTKQEYVYIKIGENLALGNFTSDTDVVTAWMNSPGHRANILDTAFSNIGVGVAYGMYDGHDVYVAVQHFGRPRSDCPDINSDLKKQVVDAENYLNELVSSLKAQKAAIDEGSATTDMTTAVTAYNNAVALYKKFYTSTSELSKKYNTEVAAFNSCLSSVTK